MILIINVIVHSFSHFSTKKKSQPLPGSSFSNVMNHLKASLWANFVNSLPLIRSKRPRHTRRSSLTSTSALHSSTWKRRGSCSRLMMPLLVPRSYNSSPRAQNQKKMGCFTPAPDTPEKLNSQSCCPGQNPVNNTRHMCGFCMSALNGFGGTGAYSSFWDEGGRWWCVGRGWCGWMTRMLKALNVRAMCWCSDSFMYVNRPSLCAPGRAAISYAYVAYAGRSGGGPPWHRAQCLHTDVAQSVGPWEWVPVWSGDGFRYQLEAERRGGGAGGGMVHDTRLFVASIN